MSPTSLQQHHPWLTTTPIIINAPMAGMAGPSLPSAVHKAGGFGFLGGGLFKMESMRSSLQEVSQSLLNKPVPGDGEILPIGIGLLLFYQQPHLDDILGLMSEFRPAAVWLFSPKEEADYEMWARKVKEASPGTKIWIQLSSVAAALEALKTWHADVLVIQGVDAGGHGKAPSASVVTLLPEVADALAKEGFGRVPLVAAGGIADGRAAAAALACGADGVVMGTAFLAAEETTVNPHYLSAVLETKDGGSSTTWSTIFDELPGENMWPAGYSGRALIAQSYEDHVGGMALEELRRLHKEAKAEEALGFGSDNRRAALWMGTGVGMVKEVRPASVIIEQVRLDARKSLQRALGSML